MDLVVYHLLKPSLSSLSSSKSSFKREERIYCETNSTDSMENKEKKNNHNSKFYILPYPIR